MWLGVSLPAFAETAAVRVAAVHAAAGDRLEPGGVLADLMIDFGAGLMRDCPPVSTCRIILQEGGWLRTLTLVEGQPVAAGEPFALLSTEADGLPASPAREARVTLASILHHDDWWSAGA